MTNQSHNQSPTVDWPNNQGMVNYNNQIKKGAIGTMQIQKETLLHMPDTKNIVNLPCVARNISSEQNCRHRIVLMDNSHLQDKTAVGICLFMYRGIHVDLNCHDPIVGMVDELHTIDYKNQFGTRSPHQKIHLSSDNGRLLCLCVCRVHEFSSRRRFLWRNTSILSSRSMGRGKFVLFYLSVCIYSVNLLFAPIFSLNIVFRVS